MRAFLLLVVGFAALIVANGCRTATRVKEVPRVDLELEGTGNRGYLVGTPPPAKALKTTRQIIESDVEIPSFYKPRHPGAPVSLEQVAPPEVDMSEEGAQAPSEMAAVGTYDTYVVQKGDSLWSIAAKPDIYGKATHWRTIFDANRDLLKSPDQLKAGMTLKIPRGEGEGASTSEDEGTSYKK